MFDYVFVLPGFSRTPVGGYKVVYQYASELSRRGKKVGILYAPFLIDSRVSSGIHRLRAIARHYFLKNYSRWFDIPKEVEEMLSLRMEELISLPTSKCYLATAWQTAEYVKVLVDRSKSKGLYLVQGVETWSASPEQLAHTYHLGLKNLAISSYVKQYIETSGAVADICFNGIDLEEFKIQKPLGRLARCRIAVMYHPAKYKGFNEVYEALEKENLTGHLLVFGAYKIPVDYQGKFEYHERPSKEKIREIYNSSFIFISGSHNEGWGLPVSEAMACGCAVIATNIPGHIDFAADGITALLYKPGNVEDLRNNLRILCSDEDLRVGLAQSGAKNIQTFTLQRSVDRLEELAMSADEVISKDV